MSIDLSKLSREPESGSDHCYVALDVEEDQWVLIDTLYNDAVANQPLETGSKAIAAGECCSGPLHLNQTPQCTQLASPDRRKASNIPDSCEPAVSQRVLATALARLEYLAESAKQNYNQPGGLDFVDKLLSEIQRLQDIVQTTPAPQCHSQRGDTDELCCCSLHTGTRRNAALQPDLVHSFATPALVTEYLDAAGNASVLQERIALLDEEMTLSQVHAEFEPDTGHNSRNHLRQCKSTRHSMQRSLELAITRADEARTACSTAGLDPDLFRYRRLSASCNDLHEDMRERLKPLERLADPTGIGRLLDEWSRVAQSQVSRS